MRVSIVKLELGEATSTVIEVMTDAGQAFTLMDATGTELPPHMAKLIERFIAEVEKEYDPD